MQCEGCYSIATSFHWLMLVETMFECQILYIKVIIWMGSSYSLFLFWFQAQLLLQFWFFTVLYLACFLPPVLELSIAVWHRNDRRQYSYASGNIHGAAHFLLRPLLGILDHSGWTDSNCGWWIRWLANHLSLFNLSGLKISYLFGVESMLYTIPSIISKSWKVRSCCISNLWQR